MRKVSLLSLTAFMCSKNDRLKAVMISLTALLLCSLSFNGYATVTIVQASGGTNICPNTAVGGSAPAFTILGPLMVVEGLNTDFSLGTDQIIINAPAGWQFDVSAPPAVGVIGGDIVSTTIMTIAPTSITIDFTTSGTVSHDSLYISGLGVQATSTSSPAGHIYATTTLGILGIVTGVGGTDLGNLSLTTAVTPSVTISVSPVGPVCTGVGITFTPTPVNSGPTPGYQWYVNGILLGTGNTYSSSTLSDGDLVYCVMTSSLACVLPPTATSDTITASIVSPPIVQTVTGGGSYCAGGTGVHVGLTGSQTGVNYQAYVGFSPVGAPVAGTGGPLDMGLYTMVGTYTVVATTGVAGCNSTMAGSVVITTIPGPTVFPMSGGGAFCSGGTGADVGLGGSATGVNYQLYLGGTTAIGPAMAGTGLALDFGFQTVAGIYTVVATDMTTGCTATMFGTSVISINSLPVAFNVTGGGSYCSGGTGVHIGLDGSALGVNYQLFNGTSVVSAPMSGTGGLLDFGLYTAAGTYTVVATDATTLCSSNMTGSATVTITPLPTIYPVTGGGGYCVGGTGVNIGLGGSDPGVNYQLYFGGVPTGSLVSGTGGALDFGVYGLTGTYTIIGTNATTTCSVNMSGSATVSINPLPTVFAITGGGIICSNSTGTDVSLSGSDIGVNYQLYVGSTPVGGLVGGTGGGISFGLQTAAGIYTATAINATTACTVNMLGTVVIAVNPAPTAFAMMGGGAFCAGGTGVDVSLSGSESGIIYQLMNGAAAVGGAVLGSGSGIDFGPQTASGSYYVIATNIATDCSDTMTGTAVVIANPLPIAFNVTGGGNYCVGGSGVLVGLDNSEAGVSYQLYYAGTIPVGVSVGGTGTAISFGPQFAPGVYTVTAVNVSTGCSNNMNGTATVDTLTLPVAYTVTGGGSYCTGGSGVDVGLSFSDPGFTYQLLNTFVPASVPLAGTGAPLDFGFQTAAGFYTVVATSIGTGCTNNMTGGVAVAILPLPGIFNVTGGGEFCLGATGAHIGLDGSETGINYELFNGLDSITTVAGTGGPIDFGVFDTAGYYTVVAVNAFSLCTSNMTGGALITVDPLPNVFYVSSGGAYCAGGAGVDITLTGSDLAVNYQLYLGTSPVGPVIAGTGSGLDFGFQTGAGVYSVIATNPVTGCNNLMSGTATVSINPAPTPYIVTGGGSDCAGGTGVDVGLNTSDVGINYQLYVNGVAVGSPLPGTGVALDFGLQTTTGNYIVIASDATTFCSDTMTGSAYVIIAPIPNVYTMAGGGTFCAGGLGVDVSLSGSDTGVNYQLYLGGTPIGGPVAGTGGVVDFGLQIAAGTYTAVATNAWAPCTAPMTGSVDVTINPAPTLYTISGGALYCTTVTGSDISLSGSDAGFNYQLYNGSSPVGTAMAGTGSSLDFGIMMTVGTYYITSTNISTSCSDTMTGTAVIAIIGYPVVDTITGLDTVCQYATFTYNDGTPTGAWSSSDPTVATIDAASGVLTAVAPGMTTIGYTVTNAGGCSTLVTMNVVVRAAPFVDVITGPSNVCAGLTVTLADATTGGIWSSSNSAIAAVSTSGVVSGIVPGSVTIFYTVAGTPCSTSVSMPFVVGNAIASSTLLPPGPLTICNGVPVNLFVTTTGGGSGLTYQWFNSGVLITGDDSMTYTASIPGTYTVAVSNGTCSEILPSVVVMPQPNAIITLDTAANLLLAGSFTRWQWYLNGSPIPGATNNYVTDDNVPGDVYTVIVWDINNCTDTSGSFIVPGVSSVNAIHNGNDIRIYPNPATNVLHIDAPMKVYVSVLTPDGKELISRREAISLNVGDLADGMYMIMVYDENNMLLKTDKFVKMQ